MSAAIRGVSSAALSHRLHHFLELTKPRLNSLVLVTTGLGYALAASRYTGLSTAIILPLLHTMLATAMCAGAGAALNQWLETDIDGLMPRTCLRPLPLGRLSSRAALRFGAALAAAGVVYLALAVNAIAALIAFLTIIIYVAVYTPLKRITTLSTLVGAVPGALPPLVGWAAASNGSLDLPAWSLFLIMFVWQMPHFLAIAWVCRDDYRAANLPILTVVDTTGHRTAAAVVTWSAVLIPVSLLPGVLGIVGPIYLLAALLLGITQLAFAVRFAFQRTSDSARSLFLCTISYLPLLLLIMATDAIILPSIIRA